MSTFHNDTIGSVQVSPLPSSRLPRNTTLSTICGWLMHYPKNVITRGMVRYRPTTTTIKLRRFTGSHIPACGQYCSILAQRGQNGAVLNQHKRGLPPWSLEYPHPSPRPSHLMILHFPLIVPSGLKLNKLCYYSSQNHQCVGGGGSYLRMGPTT
jgi:hypothetical protein